MELTYNQRKQPNFLVLLFFVVLTFLVVQAVMSYSDHAAIKHGADASLVRQCFENNEPPLQVYRKWDDGRGICVYDVSGRFGLFITTQDGLREITSYIKQKFTRIEQLEQYMRNAGAAKVYP